MREFLVFAVTCLVIVQTQAQFITDESTEEMVARTRVRDKNPRICATYDYLVQTVDGVQMVNRLFFTRSVPGFPPFVLACGAGTLYSVSSRLCGCSGRRVVAVFVSRCGAFNHNMQGDSQYIAYTQRTDETTNAVTTVQRIVEGFYDVEYIVSESCYGSSVTSPLMIPFFADNSLAQNDIQLSIGFKIPVNSNDGLFRIASNGPCDDDEQDRPSFEVTYTRNGASAGAIVLTMRVASNLLINPTEQEVQITCAITPLTRPGNLGQYVFNENDATNYVRIVGSTSNPNGMGLALRNAAIDGSADATPPRADGFCQRSTGSVAGRRGRSLIIKRRNCPLYLGQAPDGDLMCIYTVNMDRDCNNN